MGFECGTEQKYHDGDKVGMEIEMSSNAKKGRALLEGCLVMISLVPITH